ncbi:aspartate/glutamate racemase family protein [Phyllobacterium sp. LjRoot231]|uniref:aspartate/glutamate racemase family protein n=1 Tax=Phyllobacterium sp. LjRoot231 TaxID=3342289 RepID=UPI003ECC9800
MPSLALIHTVPGLAATFKPLALRELPHWNSFNIVDESLLQNTIRDGALSKKTMQRLGQYVFSAIDAGADAIVVTCSSLGDALDAIRPFSSVPLFRIDSGMAMAAVERTERIGVLATLPTTLGPTSRLIEKTAMAANRNCTIVDKLCAGAFDRLIKGDRDGHDAMVIAGFRELATSVDLIVLAQASMANALSSIGETGSSVPVLSSPELGMAYVATQLSPS